MPEKIKNVQPPHGISRVDGTEEDFLALMRQGIVFAFHRVPPAQLQENV